MPNDIKPTEKMQSSQVDKADKQPSFSDNFMKGFAKGTGNGAAWDTDNEPQLAKLNKSSKAVDEKINKRADLAESTLQEDGQKFFDEKDSTAYLARNDRNFANAQRERPKEVSREISQYGHKKPHKSLDEHYQEIVDEAISNPYEDYIPKLQTLADKGVSKQDLREMLLSNIDYYYDTQRDFEKFQRYHHFNTLEEYVDDILDNSGIDFQK